MALERSNLADLPESTHGSTCESILRLSASNCGEESNSSGSGISAVSKIEEDPDNIQAPKSTPQPTQPTSRSAQVHPAHKARSLKARTVKPGLSGVPPMAAVILPLSALPENIPLKRRTWGR